MTMLLTLKVALLHGPYAIDDWEATVEVDSESVLGELHAFIQKTLSFDDDHLYEFFVARTERSRPRITFDEERGGVYDTRISSLYPLPDRRNLYYLFDYGESWLFKITRTRTPARAPISAVKYPRLIQESGTRPPQYGTSEE